VCKAPLLPNLYMYSLWISEADKQMWNVKQIQKV